MACRSGPGLDYAYFGDKVGFAFLLLKTGKKSTLLGFLEVSPIHSFTLLAWQRSLVQFYCVCIFNKGSKGVCNFSEANHSLYSIVFSQIRGDSPELSLGDGWSFFFPAEKERGNMADAELKAQRPMDSFHLLQGPSRWPASTWGLTSPSPDVIVNAQGVFGPEVCGGVPE